MAEGDPIGTDLCSGTTNGNTLPESGVGAEYWEDREISLGGSVELTESTQYAIVVRAPNASGDWVFANWAREHVNPTVGGGLYVSADSGESWLPYEGDVDYADCWFKTKSGGVEKDDGSFVHDGYERVYIAGLSWYAQTFTADSTYTIDSVILKLSRWGDSEPGTITVSIRATEEVPDKAINPAPVDAVTTVTLDQDTITWEDGGGATSYNVYYGEDAGSLVLVSVGQEGLTFSLTSYLPFGYTTGRAWRIDSINAAGTTTGDVWTFTTITFNVPSPGIRGFGGGGGDGPGGGEETGFAGGAISDGQTNIKVRLVGVANNRFWYEDV